MRISLLNKNRFLIIFLIFIFALISRVYFIANKHYMFLDEPLSFVASTPNNNIEEGNAAKIYWYHINFPYDKEYKVKDIKHFLFGSDNSFKSALKDIKTTYFHPLDYSHPNLYFNILRLWDIGLDGTNVKQMIKRGCFLNLIFFIFSFFFMYKLLNLIKKDNIKFISLGLIFAFLSSGAISNTLLIREYAMMETAFIVVCYIFAQIFLYLKNKNPSFKLTKKKIVLYSLGLSIFLLSGYFALIMLFLIFAVLLTTCIYKKNLVCLSKLLIMLIIAFAITYLFDFHYLNLSHSEHSNIIFNTVHNLSYNIKYGIAQLISVLENYLFYANLITFILYVFIFYKFVAKQKNIIDRENLELLLILIALSVLWSIIIFILTPFKVYYDSLRYIAPAFPVLSICILLFIYNFNKFFTFCAVLLFVFYPGNLSGKNLSYYNHYYNSRLDISSQLEILDSQVGEKLPLVIITNSKEFKLFLAYIYLIYLDNDRIIFFSENKPSKNFSYKKYIEINTKKSEVGSISLNFKN